MLKVKFLSPCIVILQLFCLILLYHNTHPHHLWLFLTRMFSVLNPISSVATGLPGGAICFLRDRGSGSEQNKSNLLSFSSQLLWELVHYTHSEWLLLLSSAWVLSTPGLHTQKGWGEIRRLLDHTQLHRVHTDTNDLANDITCKWQIDQKMTSVSK